MSWQLLEMIKINSKEGNPGGLQLEQATMDYSCFSLITYAAK